jgi:hypothetical protein
MLAMRLPKGFEQRSHADWNYLVRGLVQVWDVARALGLEEELEERLAGDCEGTLVERLARLGNNCAMGVLLAWLRRLPTATDAEPLPVDLAHRPAAPAEEDSPSSCLLQFCSELGL